MIPNITGTDSRLGWGFRLGDRADFQVMLELGPQKNTQRLANQQDDNNNSKRNTLDSLTETLYAQRQLEKKIKERKIQNEKKKVKYYQRKTKSFYRNSTYGKHYFLEIF